MTVAGDLENGVRLGVPALRGERGVPTRHADGTGRRTARGQRGHLGTQTGGQQPGRRGGRTDLVQTGVHTELHESRVDRQRERPVQRYPPVGPPAVVLRSHLPATAVPVRPFRRGDRHPVVTGVQRLARHPLGSTVPTLAHPVLQSGRVHERLERRPRPHRGRIRLVVTLLAMVGTAVNGQDPPVGGHGSSTVMNMLRSPGILPARLVPSLVDGLGERIHTLLVERGVDLITTTVEILVGDVRRLLGVLGGELHQIIALLTGVVERIALQRLREIPVTRPLLRRQPADLHHPVERPPPPLHRTRPVVRTERRIVQPGPLQQRSEESRLTGVQPTDVLAVVRLRRTLDPVGATTEPTGVEITLQDLVLAHLVVELEGHHGLGELAAVGLLLSEIDVLDVLLRDRRAALGTALPDRPQDRTADPLERNARIAVETLVLGREHRPAHVLGHVLQLHRLPLHPARTRHGRPVGPEIDVVLLSGVRVQVLRNVRDGIREGQRQETQPERGENRTPGLPPGGHPALPARPPGPGITRPHTAQPGPEHHGDGDETGDERRLGRLPPTPRTRPTGRTGTGGSRRGSRRGTAGRSGPFRISRSGGRAGDPLTPPAGYPALGYAELHGLVGKQPLPEETPGPRGPRLRGVLVATPRVPSPPRLGHDRPPSMLPVVRAGRQYGCRRA